MTSIWRLTLSSLVATLLMLLAAGPTFAIAVDQNRLDDPALEAKARDLFKKYRCVVCDNQSIEDSNAEVAEDLRAIVREQVADGKDEREITEFLVARYGDFVLLEPPVKARTFVLWSVPFAALAMGLAFVIARVRIRRREDAEALPSQDHGGISLDEDTALSAKERLAKWREENHGQN